jgi:hypothetical protein
MEEDRRSFWDVAMWTDEDEHKEERRQQEHRELIIRLAYELPFPSFPGPTSKIIQH